MKDALEADAALLNSGTIRADDVSFANHVRKNMNLVAALKNDADNSSRRIYTPPFGFTFPSIRIPG